jgi:SOS-response transcriptional repressor LexA
MSGGLVPRAVEAVGDRGFDPAERPELWLHALVAPPKPRRRGDTGLTQHGGHVQLGVSRALLEGFDLRVDLHEPEYVHDCTVHSSTNANSATRRRVLSAVMADASEEARDFMRRALEVTGLSPYKLAKNAGVAPSTITRPLNDPEFKFVPKQATLAKIGQAAGLTPPKLPEPSLSVEPVSQWVPLVGEVRAGAWTRVQDEPVVEDRVPVHLPEYQRASLFAVRVAGRSMDLKYVEGTIVIALPAIEAGLRVGDDVIVRRRQGGFEETTLKEMVQEADGSYALYPRSTDSSFQPIALPRGRDHQEGPEVIGVVIYSISPTRQGRGPLVILGD